MTASDDPPMTDGVQFSVAPMMDWTDRHCRAFHRRLSARALLFSEMITADAVIHGVRERLLGFDPIEHPVALQLGGSDPEKLRDAARIGADWGYDEVNLNVGCPSDRVREGRFGACLMREPALVAECLAAIAEGAGSAAAATIKCRIGVDEQDPADALLALADHAIRAGCRRIYVHARKAWLQGLSPKENREIPPLDYEVVRALKSARPGLTVILNGGLQNVAHGLAEGRGLDGIMLGRAAYQDPAILLAVDPTLHGEAAPSADREGAVLAHIPYLAARLGEGVPLHAMTRHMLGLFHGQASGRRWRRVLSEEGVKRGAGVEVVLAALEAVGAARRSLETSDAAGQQG